MEEKLMNTVIPNLEKETGFKAKFKHKIFTNWEDEMNPDCLLELRIGKTKFEFQVITKKEIRSYQLIPLKKLKATLEAQDKNLMVIANRLFPEIKKSLQENGIAYIEESGNAFINPEGHYILIQGKKALKNKEEINRAFTKAGLKVIFTYLHSPVYINTPYRHTANHAGVAVGNITYINNGLKQLGYLVDLDNLISKLVKAEQLFNQWIEGYNKILKPSLHVGTYRFFNEDDFHNWKKLSLSHSKTYWGGEPAGNLLTGYLRPERLTLYTDENAPTLMKKHKLVPDNNGNLEVYKKFWRNEESSEDYKRLIDFEENESKMIVPSMIAYADLLNTRDSRCLETAEMIYKKYIHEKLQRIG